MHIDHLKDLFQNCRDSPALSDGPFGDAYRAHRERQKPLLLAESPALQLQRDRKIQRRTIQHVTDLSKRNSEEFECANMSETFQIAICVLPVSTIRSFWFQ